MNDNKIMKEKISALADGELSDFETRRILSEISSNPEYREFWRNIHKGKEALRDDKEILLDVDISSKISAALNKIRSQPSKQTKELDYTQTSYLIASFVGFCAVMVYSFFPTSTDSFSDIASQRIVDAIDSPQAMQVLNNSVSGLDVVLQDFKSSQKGTLANYKLPNSGETFKVSLYPLQEINKIGISEATRISYINSKNGIYVVSVSGNISTDKKNKILQQANFLLTN